MGGGGGSSRSMPNDMGLPQCVKEGRKDGVTLRQTGTKNDCVSGGKGGVKCVTRGVSRDYRQGEREEQ